MKRNLFRVVIKPALMLTVVCTAMVIGSTAQETLSQKIKQQLLDQYKSQPKTEISFERFEKINRHVFEYKTKTPRTAIGTARIGNCLAPNSLCGNGDFESGIIEATEWSGGFGIYPISGQPNPFLLSDGIVGGPVSSGNSHQTVVTPGNDPVVGALLPQVAPDGGNYAVRIGNTEIGAGTEYLSKTFVVSADRSIIPFRYAMVFQDPNHALNDQPAFSVRAYDCNMIEIPNVCDLGNGSNIARSDASDLFFSSANGVFGLIAYKDWTQSQIDLSAHIGETVTIVFTNKDCALTGHFGYTYLDNLCVVCTNGCPYNLTLNSGNTSNCGPGQICFDYELPSTGTVTGELEINLSIYQNGVQVGAAISSGTLTAGTSYCFTIDPSTLGLDASLGGFDYTATGSFSINNFGLSPITVGSPPNGQVPGQNNDYQITLLEARCKNATVTLVNGIAIITAAAVDNGSTGCGTPTLSVSPSTFNCSNIGNNTVVLTVTDNTGSTTCNATVTVVGSVPSCNIASIPSNNTYTGGNPNNLYLGYGPQSATLKVTATGGAPFTYSWSPATGLSNTTSSAPVFTPTAEGTYVFTVTVTNQFGCTTTCNITICVLDVTVPGSKGKKVYVCHVPPGNPGNAHTLSVSVNAVSAHIFSPGHGDHLGTCDQIPCANGQRLMNWQTRAAAGRLDDDALAVSALPNPSAGDFKLLVKSWETGPVSVSVANIYGHIVYQRSNLTPNTHFTLGNNFKEGTYYLEVKQGGHTGYLKLLKTK